MTQVSESVAHSSTVVEELSTGNCAQWDAYVRSAANGLPLHLSGWSQVMKKTYGYETDYLMAWSGNQIAGVLPLFMVPSRITGKRAMTMPGGLCVENDEAAAMLLDSGLQRTVSSGANRLLVQDSRQIMPDLGRYESHHVYWLVDLGTSEETLWNKLDGNIRRQVRKAKRNNLEVKISRGHELIEPFYDMFSQFTRQAGTPVFGKGFLQNIVEEFPNGYNILLVTYEEQPIAGYFQLEMGDTVYGMWGAALAATRNLRPAYLALWEIMSDAISNGFVYLDMGRSPAEANASKFKGQWGGNPYPVYQMNIMKNEQKRSSSLSSQVQSNERFQLFMQVWPYLPLSLTRYLGPRLRWHIPFA